MLFQLIFMLLIMPKSFADSSSMEFATMTIIGETPTKTPFNRDPESRSDIYGENLPELGVNKIQDLSKQIANFSSFDQGLGSFRQVYSMRGLTNTSVYGSPATIFYVDDVAYSSSSSNLGQLFDIDSVSVYRTAQPGRFGRNAYAGAVDIQTRQANNKLRGGVSLEMGSYDQHLVTANGSGALIKNKLFFTLSGAHSQRDGLLYNDYLNNHPDDQESFSGRSVLTWKPTSAWDVRLTLTKEDFDFGNGRFVRLDRNVPFRTSANVHESLKQSVDSQSLRVAHQTDQFNIVSISNRRFWGMSPLDIDLDLRPAPNAERKLTMREDSWTQELRISPKIKNQNWSWLLGGFYSNAQYVEHQDLTILGSLDRERGIRLNNNYALFGNLTYRGFNRLNLYSDLRFDYVTSHLDSLLLGNYPYQPAATKNIDYDTFFVSPKWGVDYQLSEHSLLFASTGFGFKPGGLVPGNTDQRLYQFGRETSWQNTVGIKNTWFNESLKNNIAAFYYDIDNYQVERFFANGDYSGFNAKKAFSYGVDVETQLELFDYFYVENNSGYTHIKFNDYVDSLYGTVYTGNQAPFVPQFNSVTAIQYKHPQGYFARAEWS